MRPVRFASVLGAVLVSVLTSHARGEGAREKTVKIVVHGGSVSAFRRGGYSQWLPAACNNVEVENIAQEKLGARALRERFARWLPGHERGAKARGQQRWLVLLCGANSIAQPENTNLEIARMFKLAHDAGLHTMGLTLTPWGSERDVRWSGASGLVWFARSQKTVDFVMGRLTPVQAFGKYATTPSGYLPGQVPELAIDLWDSSLRNRSAAPRPRNTVEDPVRKSSWVESQLDGLGKEALELALEGWITRATTLPRWFLRPELIGSDPIHPNSEGHKQIARSICGEAPPSWGCDCSAYDELVWDETKQKPRRRKP